jgi:hypothetical protein
MANQFYCLSNFTHVDSWLYWNALEVHQRILRDIQDGTDINTSWTSFEEEKDKIEYWSNRLMAIHMNG